MNVKMIAASDYEDRLEGIYDTIILKEVLEHVMNPLLHLERLDRHLARGGKLFLSYPPRKYEWVPMDFELNIDIDKWLKDRGYELNRLKLFHTMPVRRIKLYTKAP